MVFTHSQFTIALSRKRSVDDSVSLGVADLIKSVMTFDSVKACKIEYLERLALAYGRTARPSDLTLFSIFKLYEIEIGVSCLDFLIKSQNPLGNATFLDAFSLIEEDKMRNTINSFDVDADTDKILVKGDFYDPNFILPLLSQCLALNGEDSNLDLRQIIEKNVLGLAVMAIGSEDVNMRNVGYFCLDKFYMALEVSI
jgi:hypothetical protein